MTSVAYKGSCHCGRVSYTADLDLSQPTTKCNCTYCLKARAWTAPLKPAAFRLLSGADAITSYRKHEQAPLKHFCRWCGITVYADGDADYMGGPYVTIFVNTLDEVPDETLAEAPVRFCNGRENRWQEAPVVTSYL